MASPRPTAGRRRPAVPPSRRPAVPRRPRFRPPPARGNEVVLCDVSHCGQGGSCCCRWALLRLGFLTAVRMLAAVRIAPTGVDLSDWRTDGPYWRAGVLAYWRSVRKSTGADLGQLGRRNSRAGADPPHSADSNIQIFQTTQIRSRHFRTLLHSTPVRAICTPVSKTYTPVRAFPTAVRILTAVRNPNCSKNRPCYSKVVLTAAGSTT